MSAIACSKRSSNRKRARQNERSAASSKDSLAESRDSATSFCLAQESRALPPSIPRATLGTASRLEALPQSCLESQAQVPTTKRAQSL
eukprot:6204495-Pleurochrysis_carterae.AAC.1